VPETSSLSDLVVGSNLIIGQDIQPVERTEAPSDIVPGESETNTEQYWFTLKI
jgi:hypothetical protein